MAIVRVPRENLEDNHAAVARFARTLRTAFEDWANQPTSNTLPSLGQRMQQIAEAEYEVAFLRGKRQALPKSNLTADDVAFVRKSLQDNRKALDTDLLPDVLQKVHLQKLEGGGADVSQVLTAAFAARVENLYGGTLWRIQETGFHSGIKAIATAIRTMPRPIAQEGLLDRIRKANAFKESDFLATPETLARDAPTVDAWSRQMADEIARKQSIADAAKEDLDWSIDPPELAAALNLPEEELQKVVGDEGFRVGTQYLCERDAASCDPCIENSQGGDNGDGIYWEPDEPPYPGEDCDGYSNCRCTLETVYGS